MSCCFSRPIDVSHMNLEALRAREVELNGDLPTAKREDWKNGRSIGAVFFLIMLIGIFLFMMLHRNPIALGLGMVTAVVGAVGTVTSPPGFDYKVKKIEKELEAIRAAILTQSQSRG